MKLSPLFPLGKEDALRSRNCALRKMLGDLEMWDLELRLYCWKEKYKVSDWKMLRRSLYFTHQIWFNPSIVA